MMKTRASTVQEYKDMILTSSMMLKAREAIETNLPQLFDGTEHLS